MVRGEGATPETERLPDELFAGRFRVLDTVGRGGMGVVYRAFDRERGVEVALKTLRGISVSPEAVLRFKNEFRSLRDVRHPNLVELGELFENDGVWFFTMELIRGLRFLEWVRAAGDDSASYSRPSHGIPTDTPTDVLDATAVEAPKSVTQRSVREQKLQRLAAPRCDVSRLRVALGGLARGLGALHAAGKVHRDVKPSNILVDDTGRVVLLDFGVVAELHRSQDERMLFGTARYMAPEQARSEQVGPAADWYAVGVLVYQALTGQVPFSELSTEHLLALKQTAIAPTPSGLVDGVPQDLDALVASLLERDPQCRFGEPEIFEILGIDADEEPAWPAQQDDRIFVGRRAELHELDAALVASRVRASPVIVEGESGIGKSALVERFATQSRHVHKRLVVLRGRCHERERVPFNALDGVIDELARFLATRRESSIARYTPDDVPALLAVFPALKVVKAFTANPATGPEVRARGFRALRDLLTRVGRRRPVMIAIDDIQWADADSAALLDELVEGPDAPAICVVATKRPGDSQALSRARVLPLAGLATPDAEDLIRLVAADAGVRTDAILAETGGHPLFLRELARRHGSGPIRLDDVIRNRAAKLDPVAQKLLAAVAVAGAPIRQQIAASAVGLTPAEAEPHVAALTREQLVRVHGPRPQDPIEPFHDRIRAAVVAKLEDAVGTLRALHLALANALEVAGAPADTLFIRFDAAGEHARATEYLLRAAADARGAFAFGRAVELFRRALDAGAPAERRGWLLAQLADALAADGRNSEAAERFLEAADLAGTPDQRLDLLRRAAERFLMSGRVERGLETARALLDHVDISMPRSRARAIGGILWNQIRMRGGALAWTPRPARKPSLHADICWSMGAGLGMVDSVLGAYFSGRAARLALAEGTPLQITRAMAGSIIGAAILGRRGRAQSLLAAATRAASEDGSPLSAWYVGLARTGLAFTVDNDFVRAFQHACKLEDDWRAAGHGPAWETDVAMHFGLASLQMLGRFNELTNRVRVLVHDAKLRGDLFQEVTLRVRFGVRHLCANQPDLAKADVLDALAAWMPNSDTVGNQRMWGVWSRTRIALYAWDIDPTLETEWQRVHRSLIGRVPLMRVEGGHAYGTHLLARAIEAKRRGRASEHAALCRETERVADRIERLPFPAVSAPTSLLRAGVAWARGITDRALVDITRHALHQALAVNVIPYAAFTKRRLGEAIGGDEGARIVAEADAEARQIGFADPERAAELAIPTGRFAP